MNIKPDYSTEPFSPKHWDAIATHFECVFANEVRTELHQSFTKHGYQTHHPVDWLPVLIEEVGEVARAICEGDSDGYRAELIQVAAMCAALLYSFDQTEENE